MEFEQLSQRDPRWSSKKLGYGSGTIGSYGCTLTSLAMFAGIKPDVLNLMLRGNSFEDSAFAGETKNLIWWTRLEKYTNGLIKFIWRGYDYNESKIKDAINKNGACLVEVDFDGTGPKGDKHWILATGNQKANDPWTGNEVPTSKYPIWTGWAEILVNRKEDMTELETCLADRQKFWDERDSLYRELGKDNQSDALLEIKRLKRRDAEFSAHKCPDQPIIKPIEPDVNWELNGKTEETIVDGVKITKNYAVRR